MKHIYIFNSNSRGVIYGVGTYINNLLTALKNYNIKITVVRLMANQSSVSIETLEAVRYISIPSPNYIFSLKKDRKSNDDLDRYKKSSAILLIPFLNNDEENIFHLNFITDSVFAAHLKYYYKVSIIITVHYTDWSLALLGDKMKFKKLLKKSFESLNHQEKELIKYFNVEQHTLNNICDTVIAISHHSYNDLINLYQVSPEKITLVNNALQDSYNKMRPGRKKQIKKRLSIPEDTINIVFSGRLDGIKGVYILIKAFELILRKHKNTRLYIAGEGDFSSLMSESRLFCSNVSFTGFLNKQDMYELYSVADIGVAPSIHEEFGYVAIEMMMYQLPIVVSNSTGLAEIVTHEKTGLTATIKAGSNRFRSSVYSLADNILRLIENPQLREKLGIAARNKFKEYYDLHLFSVRMKNVYKI